MERGNLHSIVNTPSKFLRLPLAVRERIYGYSGLIRDCPIDIGSEVQRWLKILRKVTPGAELQAIEQAQRKRSFICPYDIKTQDPGLLLELYTECICSPLPVQLLRVSRQINEEAFDVLYLRNKFKLGPKDLAVLGSAAFSKILSLQVRLTACS